MHTFTRVGGDEEFKLLKLLKRLSIKLINFHKQIIVLHKLQSIVKSGKCVA